MRDDGFFADPVALLFRLPGIEATYVPWDPRGLVLFGRNGAGKTRILDAVSALFGGRPWPKMADGLEVGPCSLLVRASTRPPRFSDPLDDDEVDDGSLDEYRPFWMFDHFLSNVVAGIQQMSYPDAFPSTLLMEEEYENYARSLWKGGGREYEDEFVEGHSQRLFEVTTSARGQLHVRPYYLQDPEHPNLSRYLTAEVEEDLLGPLYVERFSTLDGGSVLGGATLRGSLIPLEGRVSSWIAGIAETVTDGPPPLLGLLRHQIAAAVTAREPDYKPHPLLGPFGAPADPDALRHKVSALATEMFRGSIGASHELELVVPKPGQLIKGDQVRWCVRMGGQLLNLEALSTGERIWANVAIYFAVNRTIPLRDTILLMDEPERGLHRSAEERVMLWLAEQCEAADNVWLWAASHSPHLLHHSSIQPVAVAGPDLNRIDEPVGDEAVLRLLQRHDKEDLEALGMSPTDLLASRRAIILVEGTHDEIVLEHLIGQDLRRLGADVVPLHGGRNLPRAVETRVLFDYTSATIFALLDAVERDTFDEAWRRALVVLAVDGHAKARDLLLQELPDSSREEVRWLRQWLLRSMERGQAARVAPIGLSKLDIIEYLPAHMLVPGEHDWGALRDSHAEALQVKGCPKDFKRWLELEMSADFSDEKVAAACNSMDEIPDEFVEILNAVRAIAMH